tara:strand:- start:4310 stop:4696 length:387 start_codon:yes stop_codon:yes gene_type:complete
MSPDKTIAGKDIGERLTRWGLVYSVGMVEFTREEVEDIVAKLQRANLRGADLRDANLRWANLYEADLQLANLSDADLGGATLCMALLYKANLRGANLSGAWYSADTKWPEGFDPEAEEVYERRPRLVE